MKQSIAVRVSCVSLCWLPIGCGAPATPAPTDRTQAVGDAGLPTGGKPSARESRTADGGTEPKQTEKRVRRFRFNYRFALTGLTAGRKLRVWLPVPQSDEHQTVKCLPGRFPSEPTYHHEPKYGNRILYFETTIPDSAELTVDVPYDVERREVRSRQMLTSAKSSSSTPEPDHRRLFLRANTNVPIDGRPIDLLKDVSLPDDPLALARRLYRIVADHVRYDKQGSGWGRGDVLWVCDSRYGNCTDFHSLFISLARSQRLPAKFEIGFPIPSDRRRGRVGGYHCWAWFHLANRGWIPVDISEADKRPELQDYYFGNLTPDRIMFTVGRDLDLVPRQEGPPLNFFVSPYAEVDGRPVPQDKLRLQFTYVDLDNAPAAQTGE